MPGAQKWPVWLAAATWLQLPMLQGMPFSSVLAIPVVHFCQLEARLSKSPTLAWGRLVCSACSSSCADHEESANKGAPEAQPDLVAAQAAPQQLLYQLTPPEQC